jgi:hypothetical protein
MAKVFPVQVPGPIAATWSIAVQSNDCHSDLRHDSFVPACLNQSSFIYVEEHPVPW